MNCTFWNLVTIMVTLWIQFTLVLINSRREWAEIQLIVLCCRSLPAPTFGTTIGRKRIIPSTSPHNFGLSVAESDCSFALFFTNSYHQPNPNPAIHCHSFFSSHLEAGLLLSKSSSFHSCSLDRTISNAPETQAPSLKPQTSSNPPRT